jgi:hypothetical protein
MLQTEIFTLIFSFEIHFDASREDGNIGKSVSTLIDYVSQARKSLVALGFKFEKTVTNAASERKFGSMIFGKQDLKNHNGRCRCMPRERESWESLMIWRMSLSEFK